MLAAAINFLTETRCIGRQRPGLYQHGQVDRLTVDNRNITAPGWSPVHLNSHMLAGSNQNGQLQRGVPHDDRISPACCTKMRSQLHSLDFWLHRNPPANMTLLSFSYCGSCRLKENYSLSDCRRWRDGTVDCCPSTVVGF